MKNLISLLLCLTILLSVTACGSVPSSGNPAESNPVSSGGEAVSDYTPIFEFTGRGEFISDVLNGRSVPVSMEICTDAAACISYEITDSELILTACEELAKISIGPESNISIEDATGKNVTFHMEDGSEVYFSFYYRFFSFNGKEYEMESNGSRLWDIVWNDPDEIQYYYNLVIEGILSDMEENIPDSASLEFFTSLSRGTIADQFGRGTNQLLLTYTPDGQTLMAAVFVPGFDGDITGDTLEIAPLAGAASCELIPGYLDGMDTVFVLYENWEGEQQVLTLYGYDVSGPVLDLVYEQSFENMDGLNALSNDGRIVLGAAVCSFEETGIGDVITSLPVS